MITKNVSTDQLNTTCASCGTVFHCGAGTGICWCCDLPNVMPVPEKTDAEKKCLCQKCLEQEINLRQTMNFDHYTIRPITLNDSQKFFQLVQQNKNRISTYFPGIVSKTRTLEETTAHIAERIAGEAEGKYMIWLIIDLKTNGIAGVVQLKDIDTNAHKREFGMLVDRSYENKGITTKAIGIMCDYCFNSLGLNKIFMRIAEENRASRRVAEKCGFKQEGILREDFTTSEGKLINLFYFGLLKSEFNQ